MSLSKSLPPARLQAPVLCELCNKGAPGKLFCTSCKKTMCVACNEIHIKLLNDHITVPRSEKPITTHTIKLKTCPEHLSERSSLYCDRCKTAVCVKCITGRHREHPILEFNSIVETLRTDLLDLENKILPSLYSATHRLEAKRTQYNETTQNIKKEMKMEIEDIKKELHKINTERLDKLSEKESSDLQFFSKREEELRTKTKAAEREIALYTKRIETCSTDPEDFLKFMAERKKLSFSIPENISLHLPYYRPKPQNEVNISGILGDLVLPSSRLNATFKPFSTELVSSFRVDLKGDICICLTQEGNAWIGGQNSDELVLVNTNGCILSRKRVRYHPWAITMLKPDDIALSPLSTDSPVVFKITKDGKAIVVYDATPIPCFGLSTTLDQQLLICRLDGIVVKSSGDGKKTERIYHRTQYWSTMHAIELNDGSICISDLAIPGLVIIGKDGNQKDTITWPLGRTNFNPRGLAVDGKGNILSTDIENNCVYIIDRNKQVQELVGSSQGICKPLFLAVDVENKLWIAQSNGKIQLVRYSKSS